MKKTLLINTILLIWTPLKAQEDWSVYLEQAHKDADYCQTFYDTMSEHKMETSTAAGYYAVSNMMLAKKYANPFVKLKYFNAGRELLDKAISKDSTNVELRFLRFAVQTEVPSLLFYFGEKEEDKRMLDNYISYSNDNLADRIWKYYNLKNISPDKES